MTIELFLKAYNNFWDSAQNDKFDTCNMVPYKKYKMAHSISHIYDSMESDFTRELLNSINQFAYQINSLTIWNSVISKYNADDQFELKLEFIKLPMYYCLNQPRAIKDRLIFCSTHLCNQANIVNNGAKDDLPEDHKIGINHFKKKGKTWEAVKRLQEGLESLASEKYTDATRNYRNMVHHRIPPNIEYGITNYVTRLGYKEEMFEYITIEDGQETKKQKEVKGVSYGFGGFQPLTVNELLPVFRKQWDLAREAFFNYWRLVSEHQDAIKPNKAN